LETPPKKIKLAQNGVFSISQSRFELLEPRNNSEIARQNSSESSEESEVKDRRELS
jgi:hypothetical protein